MFQTKKNSSQRRGIYGGLSVLKRCVPKTLAFAFGLRLRSKTRCFKTRVLGRRLPNGKPQERLRFRALRSKTLAFKKRIAIIFCDLKTSLGARACVQVLCVQKTRRFAFAFLSPLRWRTTGEVCGALGEEFSEASPKLLRSCLCVEISRCNLFWGNFLEVCFRTPRTS